MRVVQALHWLRDLLVRDGEGDQVKRKLARLFEDPTTGTALKADLAAGVTALPTWMWVFLKPLVEADPAVGLDAIKDACTAYINGPLRAELTTILQDRLRAAGQDAGAARVEADDADPDGQTLLIWYPAATPRSDYVRAAIKIEAGAKSALDPNSEVPIAP
jgi:hypothetical protein